MLEHLLRDYRSSALRKQFFANDPQAYIETLDVKLLVGGGSCGQENKAAAVWLAGHMHA